MELVKKQDDPDKLVMIVILAVLFIGFIMVMLYIFYGSAEDILRQVKDVRNSVRVNSPMINVKEMNSLFKLDK